MSEFIWATVIGIGIGAVLRYLLPSRGSYGIVLLPAIGGIVAAGIWAGATWAGWTPGAPWIWLTSLGASAIVSGTIALLTTQARRVGDAERLHRLSGGRA